MCDVGRVCACVEVVVGVHVAQTCGTNESQRISQHG